jgi:tetratricopeptide (TPR) repeat protein
MILACAVSASAAPTPAKPPPTTVAAASSDENDAAKQQAKATFDRAKELYAAGRYREAAEQLELALKYDPHGKDLVYNLALVRERLGEPDEAMVYVDRYLAMKIDANERQRAEAFRRRLEGAREEIAEKRRKVIVVPVEVERERAVDAWVWGPLLGAGAAVVSGAVFGLLAVSTMPAGYVTGRNGTYAELVSRTDEAHGYAVVSDTSWVIAALGVGTAAATYFAREPVPVATRAAESGR